jgi:hypothetical protein
MCELIGSMKSHQAGAKQYLSVSQIRSTFCFTVFQFTKRADVLTPEKDTKAECRKDFTGISSIGANVGHRLIIASNTKSEAKRRHQNVVGVFYGCHSRAELQNGVFIITTVFVATIATVLRRSTPPVTTRNGCSSLQRPNTLAR